MLDVWSGEPFGCTIVNGVVVGFLSTCGLSGDRKVSVHPESAYVLLLARKFFRWVEGRIFKWSFFLRVQKRDAVWVRVGGRREKVAVKNMRRNFG